MPAGHNVSTMYSDARDSDGRIRAGDLEVDPERYSVRKNGAELAVTDTELRLLIELMSAHGRVVSREKLLAAVWNYEYLGGSRLVDMAVKRLRDKIEDDPKEPTMIQTIRGVGYRFDAP